MSKVEALERQIEQLLPAELEQFRRWFAEFDAELWDRQIEADATAGKLDALTSRAIHAHKSGQSSEL